VFYDVLQYYSPHHKPPLKNESAISIYKISNHPVETRDHKTALDTSRWTYLSLTHDLTSPIPCRTYDLCFGPTPSLSLESTRAVGVATCRPLNLTPGNWRVVHPRYPSVPIVPKEPQHCSCGEDPSKNYFVKPTWDVQRQTENSSCCLQDSWGRSVLQRGASVLVLSTLDTCLQCSSHEFYFWWTLTSSTAKIIFKNLMFPVVL
jgi:hypothetical protein